MLTRSDSSRDEKGTAMIEFVSILPSLVMLLLGMLEVATGIEQWLLLNQIGYEGARYAASLPELEQTSGPIPDATNPQPVPQRHHRVQDRILELLVDNGFKSAEGKPTAESVTTALVQPSAGSDYSIVQVNVTVPLRPLIFDYFGGIRLRVKASAPYLVRHRI